MTDTASLKEAIDAYDAGKKYTLTELGSLLESILVPAARLVLAAQSAGSAVEAGAQALCQYAGDDWTDEPTRDDYRADVKVVLRAASLSGTVERWAGERAFKLRSPTMRPDFVYVSAANAAEAVADFERHNPHHTITHVDDAPFPRRSA